MVMVHSMPLAGKKKRPKESVADIDQCINLPAFFIGIRGGKL
jgi:hypothetical protein